MPIFLLVSANDNDDSLKQLDREVKQITKYFLPLLNRIQLVSLPNISIEDLFNFFKEASNDIIGFHFSGHANTVDLYFEGEVAGNSKGLSDLIALAPNLKFLFLNGCATYNHLDLIFRKSNVKAAIATSQKVFDKTAADFAIYFYAALCRSWTVGKAFNYARAYILTEKDHSLLLFKNQSRYLENDYSSNLTTQSLCNWGIYYKHLMDSREQNKFENWTLPEPSIQGGIIDYEPNHIIIEKIAGHAQEYYNSIHDLELDESLSNEFQALIKYYNETFEMEEKQYKVMARMIRSLMPFPLAIKFQIMQRWATNILNKNSINDYFKLLGSQLAFYKSITQLWALIMLSDLFDFLEDVNEQNLSTIKISKGEFEIIRQYFSLTKDNFNDFDFITLSKSVRQVLENNEKIPFVEEYKLVTTDFIRKDISNSEVDYGQDSLFEIHMNLKGIEARLFEERIDKQEIIALCKKVEEILWVVMKKAYFFLKYKLVVIRKIEIIRFRKSIPANYSHFAHFFKNEEEEEENDENLNNAEAYTDSYSVLLIKAIKSFTKFVNLSPLVIDLNVLTEIGDSQLFIYSYSNENEGLVYNQVENFIPINFKYSFNKQDCEYTDFIKPALPPAIKRKINFRLCSLNQQFEKFKEILSKLQPK